MIFIPKAAFLRNLNRYAKCLLSSQRLSYATLLTRLYKFYTTPAKVWKLNDLSEPSIHEIEETWGLELNVSTENYSLTGRGSNFTSSRLRRQRKQPVRIIRKKPITVDKSQQEAEVPCRYPLPVGATLATTGFTVFWWAQDTAEQTIKTTWVR